MSSQQYMLKCLERFDTSHEKSKRDEHDELVNNPCEKTITGTHAINDGNEKRPSACEERFRFL